MNSAAGSILSITSTRVTDRSGDGELQRTFEVEGFPPPQVTVSHGRPRIPHPGLVLQRTTGLEPRVDAAPGVPRLWLGCGANRVRRCPLFWRRCIVPTLVRSSVQLRGCRLLSKAAHCFVLSFQTAQEGLAAFLSHTVEPAFVRTRFLSDNHTFSVFDI